MLVLNAINDVAEGILLFIMVSITLHYKFYLPLLVPKDAETETVDSQNC